MNNILAFFLDRFFRNRYEELLTEQGMHVRQIIKKAAKSYDDKCCIADTDPSSVEVIIKEKIYGILWIHHYLLDTNFRG